MKYDIDLDPNDANTSHGVIVDLVGTGKRVLDVGCSTGYLSRLLKERGNGVVGIEIDPEAAAQAEPWLEQTVVGDLEQLDLIESLGAARFDVIVFADVLEHLADPLRVLRQAAPLLQPGGSVIVSIPNVAHAAVRLALLEGRFDYRPLGLLDDTHLRFFTRTTLEDLLRASGLVAVERRRTTAEIFATEIPVDAERFSSELVDRLRGDEDSTTYQFVIRAIPTDEGESARALAAELLGKDEQIQHLRAEMDAIVREAADPARGPAVGVVSGTAQNSGGALDALRLATLTGELRRRLSGFSIRCYGDDAVEPSVAWTGEAVYPLLPWSDERPAEVAAAVDAVLVAGDPPPEEWLSGLARQGCPILLAGSASALPAIGGSGPGGAGRPSLVIGRPRDEQASYPDVRFVPDVLLLASRLHPAVALQRRVDYLRLLDRIPVNRPYAVIGLWAVPETASAAVARSLDELARRHSATLVLVGDGTKESQPAFVELLQTEHRLFDGDEPFDLLAVVAGSHFGVTDSAALLALAVGLQRPYQALAEGQPGELVDLAEWLGDPDAIADRPVSLLTGADLAVARSRDQQSHDRLVDVLDLALDDLADGVRSSIGRRAAITVPVRLRELSRRIAVLDGANRALQLRMAQERAAFGNRARELVGDAGSSSLQQLDSGTMSETEIRLLRFKYEQAEKELAAVYATKTMRVLKPARTSYRRLRSLGR